MAHGAPDYFGTTPQGLVHRVADLAELAARLKSPVTFDRRGNVLYLDSFDNGLAGWTFVGSGGAAAGYALADPTHMGGVAVGIYTQATAGATSTLYRYIPLPVLGRMGVEIAFCLPLNARDVVLGFSVFTGTLQYGYFTRWRQSTGVLAVLNSAFAYQTVATLGALYTDGTTWYVLKLVFDPTTGKYVRLIFCAVQYNVSAITAWSTADATAATCEVQFSAAPNTASSITFPFDDVVVTMNE